MGQRNASLDVGWATGWREQEWRSHGNIRKPHGQDSVMSSRDTKTQMEMAKSRERALVSSRTLSTQIPLCQIQKGPGMGKQPSNTQAPSARTQMQRERAEGKCRDRQR